MPPPSTVRMVTPEGEATDVPLDQVEYARSRGYDFETGTDLGFRLPKEADAQAKANRGILGDVAAFGAGVARGATLGLSDVVLPDLGVERETLTDLQRQHGTASTLGEVGGAVGAALLSGGSSATASVARATPAGLASALGSRVAAPGGIARYAAGGAIEGAAQNAGSYLSDVALRNKDLSAEGFVASVGTGAAYGGAIGGGLGIAEKGLVKARDLFPKMRASKDDVIRAADEVDVEVQRALSAGDEAKLAARDQLELMRLQNLELDNAAKQRVLEKRAAEAAAAQSRADLAAFRLEKAKAPKAPRSNRRKQAPAETPEAPATAADVPAATADAPPPTDVAGPPIASVPPSAGGDLESLLGQSIQRVQAGEAITDIARSARPPTVLDEVHEAMAEIDPTAAKLVNAVKAQEAAGANLERRFRVRAPQQVGGTELKVIPDAPNLTLGRVKQMYEKANETERIALLQQVGPEKAKALLEIVEGKAGFAKWYKNKHHWWDDPSYSPLPERAGPSPDDLGDLSPNVMPGGETRLVDDDIAALDDMERAMGDVQEYERSVHDLAVALGPTAPPAVAERAARFGAAVDDQARKQTDRMAQVADEAPTPVLAHGSGPVAVPDAPLTAPVAAAADPSKAASLVGLPGAKAPAKRGGVLGLAADIGAANEALQAVGVDLPIIPDVSKIPVIGPLADAYFKLRAGATVLSKAGFRVPFTGEAKVAAGAAKTRDRVAQSIDRALAAGIKATQTVRPVAAAQGWRVAEVLSRPLYDTGEPRRKFQGTPAELLRHRVSELRAYEESPQAAQASVRQALRDVRDPDVIAAVVAVTQRKLTYLSKHAPIAPPPSPLSKSTWTPSPAEVERFARRVRAANDPVSVLDDVATGRVTPEAAETLREVYPNLYAEAQQRLIEQAPKLQRSLPHATVVRLSVLFDAAMTPSLEPETMIRIQSVGAEPQQPVAPPPTGMGSPPPAGAPNLSSFYMTPGEQRAAR